VGSRISPRLATSSVPASQYCLETPVSPQRLFESLAGLGYCRVADVAKESVDLPREETGELQMPDDISFIFYSLMVGHDSLLSGTTVGGTSLYL
jgi:hypothetical protein